MAQEVTAHFPSLQMTLNNNSKSASCLKGQNRRQSAKHDTSFIGTAEGREPAQSLILGML